MNSDTSHLSPDDLAHLLEETLNGRDQERIESHLESCADCRNVVAGQGGDDRWWKAASTYLRESFDEPKAPSHQTVEEREIATVLSATDDPRMLGRLGGYEIAGIVGSGGMGIVLKGLDVSLNRYVAIKVLRPSQATSSSARIRFEREGRAAASIVHENVIAIHGVAETNGVPYLVMPYIRGESLATAIERRGPLRLEEMLRIGCQVAGGLAAAHEQGVIHRDVKPSNILLENGLERLKLTDFGLARAVDDVGLTNTGILAGTPEYMSPEQVRGEVLDARSDLFSLGCVLYALCTGVPPFRAESSYAVLRSITWPSHSYMIRVMAGLATAWFVISVVSRIIKNRFIARVVATIAWAVTAPPGFSRCVKRAQTRFVRTRHLAWYGECREKQWL